MIWVATILFFIVLEFDVLSDYGKWLKGESINHKKEFWLRIALLSPSLIMFIVCRGQPIVLSLIATFAMTGFVYWTLFDGQFNLLRKQRFFFTGSDDPDDATTDNFLQQIPEWLQAIIKIGGSLGALFFYFK